MSCQHRQAHEVTLSTGEIVACLCEECHERLPAQWVTYQLIHALRAAYCAHEDTLTMGCLEDAYEVTFCSACGIELDLP